MGPVTQGDFVRLQSDFYQKYGEHKDLPQYTWRAWHITFPMTSSSAIFSKLP